MEKQLANFCIAKICIHSNVLSFLFSEKGLDHVAEKILSYLDAKSLREAELVCKEWHRVIADGLLWKKLIERKVRTDPLWRGLSERKGWYVSWYSQSENLLHLYNITGLLYIHTNII